MWIHNNIEYPVSLEGNKHCDVLFINHHIDIDSIDNGHHLKEENLQVLTTGFKMFFKDITYGVISLTPCGVNPVTKKEIDICSPLLYKQIDLIKPKVIITLGLEASKKLFGYIKGKMKDIVKEHDYYIAEDDSIPMYAMYSPEYLNRLMELDRFPDEFTTTFISILQHIKDSKCLQNPIQSPNLAKQNNSPSI